MKRLKQKTEDASVRRKGNKKKTNLWKDTNETLKMLDFQLGNLPSPNEIGFDTS